MSPETHLRKDFIQGLRVLLDQLWDSGMYKLPLRIFMFGANGSTARSVYTKEGDLWVRLSLDFNLVEDRLDFPIEVIAIDQKGKWARFRAEAPEEQNGAGYA